MVVTHRGNDPEKSGVDCGGQPRTPQPGQHGSVHTDVPVQLGCTALDENASSVSLCVFSGTE